MKKVMRVFTGSIMFAFLTLAAFAQAPMVAIQDGGKMPNKLDTVEVPKEVRVIYITEYPEVAYVDWYGYPTFADNDEWFSLDTNLYVSRGVTPEYYVSEFTSNNMQNKVVYDKKGKKIATHRHINNAQVPVVVANAFEKSGYKQWSIVGNKVEIIREADKSKVYKVTVSKGNEKHSLFYDSKGRLLKDKRTSA